MANVYGQLTKINNAQGRSDYISNPDRQEEIVLHDSQMKYDWKFYHEYEKKHSDSDKTNIEALEIIVALPNELYEEPDKLKAVCGDICQSIIKGNNDYEYSVHWNHNRTNLHMHLMFSEREKVENFEPKLYKKDIWQDKDTGKLAKANAENAILVHRKGDIQKDKEGNIKYNEEPLTAKNRRFNSSTFVQEKNHIISEVMERYGFDLAVQDKTTPYLSQKKLHKGWKEDYLENAREYNEAVKGYNQAVKEHIQIEPEQKEVYVAFRNQIESAVKDENRPQKKLTLRAVEIIRDMRDTIRETVQALKVSLSAHNKVERLMDWYRGHKKQFDAEFGEIDKLRYVQIVGKSVVAKKTEIAESKKALWDDAKEQETAAIEAVNNLKRQIEQEERKEATKAQAKPVRVFVEESIEDDFVYEISRDEPLKIKNTAIPEKKLNVKDRLKEAERQVEAKKPEKKPKKERGGWER